MPYNVDISASGGALGVSPAWSGWWDKLMGLLIQELVFSAKPGPCLSSEDSRFFLPSLTMLHERYNWHHEDTAGRITDVALAGWKTSEFFMCGRPKRNAHEPSVQVKWDAFCFFPLLVGSRLVQPDRGASAVAGEKESSAACLAVGVKRNSQRPVGPPA